MVYGCDAAWWLYRRGLPEFNGLKLSFSDNRFEPAHDIVGVRIAKAGKSYANDLLFDSVGTVGGGGNSGFQALNLAVQFGARRIILIGYDMTDRSGVHWYGRNHWPRSSNPDQSNFRRWIVAYDKAAKVLAERGVEVVNASMQSALTCFPKRSIEDALASW